MRERRYLQPFGDSPPTGPPLYRPLFRGELFSLGERPLGPAVESERTAPEWGFAAAAIDGRTAQKIPALRSEAHRGHCLFTGEDICEECTRLGQVS